MLFRSRRFFQKRTQIENPGTFGINLITQKTNIHLESHLKVCVEERVPFVITSLGSPEVVIDRVHAYGGKVFCDVINLEHARKCAKLGCDGFIAVGQGAGGHAGPHPLTVLIPALRREFPEVPVVAAGGIADGGGLVSMLSMGACGISCGTLFIASEEAGVSRDYKNAIVDSGMGDIMMTERLSGTPCSVIQTPFALKIGARQNLFERFLDRKSTRLNSSH